MLGVESIKVAAEEKASLPKFLGTITKYGTVRSRGGDKVRTICVEVFGSFEGLDALMEKPLAITIEEEKALSKESNGR